MHNIAAFYLFLQITLQIFFFSEYGRHLFKIASMQNGAILVYTYEKTLQDFDFKVHLIHFKILRTFHLFVGGTPK